MAENDSERLNRILEEVYTFSGETSLWQDLQWLQQIQIAQPDWAKPIFAHWQDKTHALSEALKQGVR